MFNTKIYFKSLALLLGQTSYVNCSRTIMNWSRTSQKKLQQCWWRWHSVYWEVYIQKYKCTQRDERHLRKSFLQSKKCT